MSHSNILVLGSTGTGRTSFVNCVTNSELQVSAGLFSCTSDVQLSKPLIREDRSYLLVDTPGFDHSDFMTRTNDKTLDDILKFLTTERDQLTGILYFLDVSDHRFLGSAESSLRILRCIMEHYGVNNVVIVAVKGLTKSQDGETQEDAIAPHLTRILGRTVPMKCYEQDDKISASQVIEAIINGYETNPLSPISTSSLKQGAGLLNRLSKGVGRAAGKLFVRKG